MIIFHCQVDVLTSSVDMEAALLLHRLQSIHMWASDLDLLNTQYTLNLCHLDLWSTQYILDLCHLDLTTDNKV